MKDPKIRFANEVLNKAKRAKAGDKSAGIDPLSACVLLDLFHDMTRQAQIKAQAKAERKRERKERRKLSNMPWNEVMKKEAEDKQKHTKDIFDKRKRSHGSFGSNQ